MDDSRGELQAVEDFSLGRPRPVFASWAYDKKRNALADKHDLAGQSIGYVGIAIWGLLLIWLVPFVLPFVFLYIAFKRPSVGIPLLVGTLLLYGILAIYLLR